MKIGDHLNKEKKQQLEQTKKRKEKLSCNDLNDLMGTRRETYRRVHGVIRRK